LIVEFKTRKLEKCYGAHKLAVKEFGDLIGKRYIHRINIIKATVDISELMRLPALRCHPLTHLLTHKSELGL
jgi:proteic killer suppression protein